MNNMFFSYYVNDELKFSYSLENDHYKIEVIQDKSHLKFVLNPKVKLRCNQFRFELPFNMNKNDQYFLNGYQSWTDSGIYSGKKKIRNMKKIPNFLNKKFEFDKYGDTSLIDDDMLQLHGFTYGYIRGEKSLFFGSLNFSNAYLIYQFRPKDNKIILSSDVKGKNIENTFTLLDIVFNDDVDKGLEEYFSRFNCDVENLIGFTSWYNYYQNIDEDKILNCLDSIDVNKFNLFQIDDGYQCFVGDWMDIDRNKFPNGLKNIVEKIHQKNLKAGIWLAPFVCEKNSRVFNEHYNFLALDDYLQPIKAGGNWSGFYALDLQKEEVKDYIKTCLEYFIELGFDFFKLDFLYTACLIDTKGKTRAEVCSSMMDFLRNILKDKLIDSCGVPLSSAFNKTDYCRIGPDVSLKFDDVFYMRFFHRERISTKNSILNTMYRKDMSKHVFNNDPDVYVLRDKNNSLTIDQKISLLTVNILFGDLLMTSDNYLDISSDNKKLIDDLLDLKKHIVSSKVLMIDKNTHKAIFNLDDKSTKEFIYYSDKGKLIWN